MPDFRPFTASPLFLSLGTWLLLHLGLPTSEAWAQARLTLNPPSPAAHSSATTENQAPTQHGFIDGNSNLSWTLEGLPSTEVKLLGRVFAVGGSMAAPVPDLAFELTAQVAPGHIKTVLRHALPTPGGQRPQTYLVRWQATLSGVDAPQSGALRLHLWPRGILAPLKHVWLTEHDQLLPLRTVLENDGVEVTTLAKGDPLPADWQGLFIEWPKADGAEAATPAKLATGQVWVQSTLEPPTSTTWFIAQPLHAGRHIRLPIALLDQLPENPELQKLLVEASLASETAP